jgi:hypothetical protein
LTLKEKGPPNLAERLLDLESLGLIDASHTFSGGQKLVFRAPLSPSPVSRIYTCELHVFPGSACPEMIVVEPNLKLLAKRRKLPHTYPYSGNGVRLCLWSPKLKEWDWHMNLSDTYIPWTVRWLWYFEDWLYSDEWAGGGDHPDEPRRRFGVERRTRSAGHKKL